MSSKLSIELPNQELSAADLVGKSFRIARLNFRELFSIFLAPTAFWCLGFQIVFASAYYSYLSSAGGVLALQTLIGIAFLGGLIQLLAGWEIGIRTLAVAHTLSARNPEYSQSMNLAREKRYVVLRFTVAALAVEWFSSAVIFSAQSLNNMFYNPGGPLYTPENILIAGLHAIFLIAWLPHIALYVFNGFMLSVLVAQNFELRQAWKEILKLTTQNFRYIFFYTILMTLPCLSFYLPNLITKGCELLPFFHLRELLSLIVLLILEAPIYAFFFSAIAIGGAYLHKQFSMRDSGKDLLEQLENKNM